MDFLMFVVFFKRFRKLPLVCVIKLRYISDIFSKTIVVRVLKVQNEWFVFKNDSFCLKQNDLLLKKVKTKRITFVFGND